MSKRPCIHCAIIELINQQYPDGMSVAEASEVLRSLACVAGEILQIGTDASRDGFVDIVDMIRCQGASATVVSGTRH